MAGPPDILWHVCVTVHTNRNLNKARKPRDGVMNSAAFCCAETHRNTQLSVTSVNVCRLSFSESPVDVFSAEFSSFQHVECNRFNVLKGHWGSQ